MGEAQEPARLSWCACANAHQAQLCDVSAADLVGLVVELAALLGITSDVDDLTFWGAENPPGPGLMWRDICPGGPLVDIATSGDLSPQALGVLAEVLATQGSGVLGGDCG